jgi:hypothetical protein
MKDFKIYAMVRCGCPTCQGAKFEPHGKQNEGVPIADVFSGEDVDAAIKTAEAKFDLIKDQLNEEFEGEGHELYLKIFAYEEVTDDGGS